jgi:hypothetical protein
LTTPHRPGLTPEVRDPALGDLAARLDEAEALRLDVVALPMAELPLILGGRVRALRRARRRAPISWRKRRRSRHARGWLASLNRPPA